MSRQQQRLRMAAVICLAGLCSTAAQSASPSATRASVSNAVAAEVVDLTNVERARQRRGPLRPNPRLMRAAQLHAEQMARYGQMAHVLPNATYPRAEDRLAAANYLWQSYGENVAMGQPGAPEVLESWMHSRGHRKNILNSDFTEMGAGYALDRAGRPYWVQLFGSPRS